MKKKNAKKSVSKPKPRSKAKANPTPPATATPPASTVPVGESQQASSESPSSESPGESETQPKVEPPKRPPKKSGRRGIGPAPEPAEPASANVKEQGSSLLVEQPKKPKIVGQRFEVFFLKPAFAVTPKGDRMIGLRLTTPLEKDHDGVLPEIIVSWHKNILKKGGAGVAMRDIPAQLVRFYLAHDSEDPILTLEQAQILNARIDVIQRKGEGESRRVIRLNFMPRVKVNREVGYFCDNNFNNSFWLEMTEVEPDLLDLEEENDEE